MIRVVHPGSRIHNTDFKGCRCTIHVGSLTTSLLLKEENTSDPKLSCGFISIRYGSGISEEVWVQIQDGVFSKKICEVVYDFDFISILSCCKLTRIVFLIKKDF